MTLPTENLDDKTFDDLVRDALSRIPIYAPGWTDRNLTDPGITFIELFAWLAEMQIYRLNRIDDKSYKKFLKLLGLPGIRSPIPAEVDVTFSLLKGDTDVVLVPEGTKVAAVDPLAGSKIIFETVQDLNVAEVRLEKILTRSEKIPTRSKRVLDSQGSRFVDNTLADGTENVYYFAFGSEPKEGDALYLGFGDSPKGGDLTLAFYVYESRSGGDLEEHTCVVLRWELFKGGDREDDASWIPLSSGDSKTNLASVVKDETKSLTTNGKIWIRIGEGEEMERTSIDGFDLFWMRCRIEKGFYEMPPKVDRIRLNTISAVQRELVDGVKFSSSGLPNLTLSLDKKPVVLGSLKVECEERFWKEVEDLDASGPGDDHYILDLIGGRLTFGDGVRGRVPPKGEENIIVSYRSGGGVQGNVDPHAICEVVDEGLRDLVKVDNELGGRGGEDAGTLEEAVARAKRETKKVTRAVTSSDYEHLALNAPGIGVARAKAIPMFHPIHRRVVPDVVSVIVVPDSPELLSVPSPGFLKAVYRHLDESRLLTTELFVIPPVYVKVSVKATVVKMREHLATTVKAKVSLRLINFLHPTKGGPDGVGWPFGRPVYVSEIFETIGGTEGVDYVKSVTLLKEGLEQDGDVLIPKHGLVYSDVDEAPNDIEVKEGQDIEEEAQDVEEEGFGG
jgi:hypothetical protein